MKRSNLWLAGALVLGTACGDDLVPVSPDATPQPDEPDAGDPTPACVEQSGHACVWLGQTLNEGFNGDGHHRLDTVIYWSMDMEFMADGTAFFIDWNNHLVRRVKADGTVESVVGWNDPIFPGDGTGDTTEKSVDGADGSLVKLNHPTEMVTSPDGKLRLMAWHNHKLREIDPATGKVHIIGGAGAGFRDGAIGQALFKQPKALIVDEDGNYYIGDQQNFKVRKLATDGTITTIVGNGTQGSAGDDGAALAAQLGWEAGQNPEPSGGLAIKDGKLYIADTLSNTIRVVDLETGIITRFAGTGAAAYGGDGGPALQASFNAPRELEIGPDGDLYVADTDNSVIRAIDLDTGEVRTVVGTGRLGAAEEDGLPALDTPLRRPFGLEFDLEGNLYVMDTMNSRILKVTK